MLGRLRVCLIAEAQGHIFSLLSFSLFTFNIYHSDWERKPSTASVTLTYLIVKSEKGICRTILLLLDCFMRRSFGFFYFDIPLV